MNEKLIGHECPVDSLARRLFWKAPWWAKVPDDEKRQIEKTAERISTRVFVDYFKEPPVGTKRFQIFDLRGVKIRFEKGEHKGQCAIITGFGFEKRKEVCTRKNRNTFWAWQGHGYSEFKHYSSVVVKRKWWAMLIDSGEFVTIDSAHRKGRWVIVRGADPKQMYSTNHRPDRISSAQESNAISWEMAPPAIKRMIIQMPSHDTNPDVHYEALRAITRLGWRIHNHRDKHKIMLSRLTPSESSSAEATEDRQKEVAA